MAHSRRLLVLLLTALAHLAASAGIAVAQDPGRDYYLAGSYPDGLQMLRNLDRNHYRPAAEKLARGQYKGVQGDLEFMLKYFPNHPRALAGMAALGVATKRPDEAERYFQNAIDRYPGHDETHVVYGTFLHKLGRIEAAIAQYKRALEINPDSAYGHYNLGLAYVDQKDYQQANIHAQRAYQLGASFPGLRRKLEAVKAWNPSEGASAAPANAN